VTLKVCAIVAGLRARVQPTENGSKTGMSRIIIVMVLVAGALWPLERATAQTHKPEAAAAQRAELSYALGYEAGLDLGQRKLDIDIATVLRGVQDGFSRKKPAYPPQQMQQVIHAMQQKMLAEARAAYEKLAADNLKKSHQFFATNKKKAGVVTLPSGVQYKVLDGGSGDKSPTIGSKVTLQYRGAFLDGTVFDNTEDRGKPVVFPVNQMIPGWRQIITRMHVGDHWQVFIPPDQAYGIRGDLPRIGPNEALVFDIRLLGVQP
jgi:FKBP-type peptidyl-prolyl cis-trans isomerase FklB